MSKRISKFKQFMYNHGYEIISTGGGFCAWSKNNGLKGDNPKYLEIIINTEEDLRLPRRMNERVLVSFYGVNGYIGDGVEFPVTTCKDFVGSKDEEHFFEMEVL